MKPHVFKGQTSLCVSVCGARVGDPIHTVPIEEPIAQPCLYEEAGSRCWNPKPCADHPKARTVADDVEAEVYKFRRSLEKYGNWVSTHPERSNPSEDEVVAPIEAAVSVYAERIQALVGEQGNVRVPCRACNGADTAAARHAECYNCRNKPYWENEGLHAEITKLRAENKELLHQAVAGYPSVEEVGVEGLWQSIADLRAENETLRRERDEAREAMRLTREALGAIRGTIQFSYDETGRAFVRTVLDSLEGCLPPQPKEPRS